MCDEYLDFLFCELSFYGLFQFFLLSSLLSSFKSSVHYEVLPLAKLCVFFQMYWVSADLVYQVFSYAKLYFYIVNHATLLWHLNIVFFKKLFPFSWFLISPRFPNRISMFFIFIL